MTTIKIKTQVVSLNPVTKKEVISNVENLGHISRTGYFHFHNGVPLYIKNAVSEKVLSKIDFIKGIVNA